MVEPLEVPLEFMPGIAFPGPEPPLYIPGSRMPLVPPPSAFDRFVPGAVVPLPRLPRVPDDFVPGEPVTETPPGANVDGPGG